MEQRVSRDYSPPVIHPEWYYGFLGVTLVWQFMYMLIGRDPIRYRPAMLLAVAAKSSFVATVLVLYARERVGTNMLAGAAFDGLWVVLFLVAFVRIPSQRGAS
jgi:hypothetical protein